MAAQFCPYCGKPISALGATFCAFCGRSLTGQAPQPGQPQPGQPQPGQPQPPGANPPGMVAVPIAAAPPVYDAPSAGVASGSAYYPAPPPAYGAGYPPPGYTSPPPTFAAYGVPAYAPVASAQPAFSTSRAVWCAIAVAVLGIVAAVYLGAGNYVLLLGPKALGVRLYGFPRNYYGFSPDLVLEYPLALGIPAAFWLGLARLPYARAWRAWAEAIGINTVLSVAMVLITLLILRSIYYVDFSYTVSDVWWQIVGYAAIGGLVAGAIGAGLAALFATWPAVQAQTVARQPVVRLLLAIGVIVAVNLAHIAVNAIGGDRFFYIPNDKVGILLGIPLVIAFAWYAAWSTLRLLRQPVPAPATPAPAMPVAPGV